MVLLLQSTWLPLWGDFQLFLWRQEQLEISERYSNWPLLPSPLETVFVVTEADYSSQEVEPSPLEISSTKAKGI